MFCTQCGSALLPGATFCGNCGAKRAVGDELRQEVEGRETRGLKLCVKCRSEIPLDATLCHRCDASQPGSAAYSGPVVPPVAPAAVVETDETPSATASPESALPLASIMRRIAAYVIDIVVLVFISFFLALITNADIEGASQERQLTGYIVITFTYFIVAEALTGQTIGKRLTGIRVVRLDGTPIGWRQSTSRNLMRIVDSLPALYIVGIIVMARSDSLQRVGDRLAKTVVVTDKTA